ncbi:MAG: 6,7-dimethyl-8-ribityllumazine synthase [Chloroflexi bacterium]|nr:6,7-dimethyl-8-ribityllumazine synthase [Chloroflexota bacterium]
MAVSLFAFVLLVTMTGFGRALRLTRDAEERTLAAEVARRLAETRRYAAVICLGCVIKGETLHFDLVARNAAAGMARVALETGVPVINEVLAVFDPAHAAARAGGTVNRGEEAARAAIRMATLLRTLPG